MEAIEAFWAGQIYNARKLASVDNIVLKHSEPTSCFDSNTVFADFKTCNW